MKPLNEASPSSRSLRFARYQSLFLRYGLAVFAVEIALLLRWVAQPWLGAQYPLVLIVAAVAAAVWYGGTGPAVFATIAGYWAANALFVSPLHLPSLAQLGDWVGLGAYLLSCSVVIALARAAQKSEQRLRLSQEAGSHGYAMLSSIRDDKGRIIDFRWDYVNPLGAKMLRHSPPDMIGHRLLHLLPEEPGRPGLFRAMSQAAQSGEPADLEVRYDYHDLQGWFRCVTFKHGDGVLLSFTDVSDRKSMEQALIEQTEELRKVERNRTEFVSLLAHELRNPLAPIRTSLYLIRAADKEQRVAPYTAVIERQVNHLVRLIDDVLDLSRIDTGKLEVRPQPCELNAVIREALDAIQPIIEQRSQHLKVHLLEQPAYLSLDPVRMAQAFGILLDNAVQFTPREGRLSLSVRKEPAGLRVDIADEGRGVTRANRERIFEPFPELEAAEGRPTLGLGLSLVKRLVELHGGRVQAGSHPQGNVFSVHLPSALQVEAPQPAEAAERGRPHYKVVVVDDNTDAAETLAHVLKSQGHEVEVVFDGVQAVERINELRPEAALVDIGMPELDGYQVAKAVRGKGADKTVLIAVTGWGSADDKQRAVEAGFDYHLTKPVDLAELDRLLETPRRA